MSASSKLLIVVDGQWASGKSHLAKVIGETFGITVLSKDDYKEILFNQIGVRGRKHSRKLGAASFEILFASLDVVLAHANCVLIETMFDAIYSPPRIKEIATHHQARILHIHLAAPFGHRAKRNADRIKRGQRHRGHWDFYSRLKIWVGARLPPSWLPERDQSGGEPMELGGERIIVDTTSFSTELYQPVITAVGRLVNDGT